MIEEVVAPVDQINPVPDAASTELPHPSTAVTVGGDGMDIGFADTEAGALVHPPAVCVTV